MAWETLNFIRSRFQMQRLNTFLLNWAPWAIMHHNTEVDYNFVPYLKLNNIPLSDNRIFPSALQPLEFRTALLTFSGVKRASTTHTFGDITLKLVEDLLNGLHMRPQVQGFLRHTCQGSG